MIGWVNVLMLCFIVHTWLVLVLVVSVAAVAESTTWRPRRSSFLLSSSTVTSTIGKHHHHHHHHYQNLRLSHRKIWGKKKCSHHKDTAAAVARCRMMLDLRCGSDTYEEDKEEEVVMIDNPVIEDEEAIIIATAITVDTTTNNAASSSVVVEQPTKKHHSLLLPLLLDDEQELVNTIIHNTVIIDESEESSNNSSKGMEEEEEANVITAIQQQQQLQQLQQLQHDTINKRTKAKKLHDCGKLHDAAVAYSEAGLLLDEIILLTTTTTTLAAALELSVMIDNNNDNNNNNTTTTAIVDRATCKLHEALCLLKDGRPKECITACTNILVDDQQGPGDNDNSNTMQYHGSSSSSSSSNTNNILPLPAQIRGRAYFRRAKAKLAIHDINGALDDAHSGAFLGDKNAVQLYGKLMRQRSSSSSLTNDDNDGPSKDISSSILHNLLSSSGRTGSSSSGSIWDNQLIQESMAELLLGRKENEMDINKSQQRRNKRNTHHGRSSTTTTSTKNDSLVKSILTSLMKHIEDEDTQQTICNLIQSTNSQQVLQYASMAGIPIKIETASRLVSLVNGITPKVIHNSLSKIKIGYTIIMSVRQIFKVIDDYKSIIIVIVLLLWLKNAFVEPAINV